jgi:hypothetical protein
MTTDWRIYEMLTKETWRQGDEPEIVNKLTIRHGDYEIVVPLPAGATVDEVGEGRDRDGVHHGSSGNNARHPLDMD